MYLIYYLLFIKFRKLDIFFNNLNLIFKFSLNIIQRGKKI